MQAREIEHINHSESQRLSQGEERETELIKAILNETQLKTVPLYLDY